jgi:excisionase family DNA binding protein
MNRETQTVIDGIERQETARRDMEVLTVLALRKVDEETDPHPLEMHYHHRPHDHAHVDLLKEEYVPDEVACMLGTSVEVIMRAIRRGELRAERKGRHVISIPRTALIAWYKTRS